MSIQTLIAGLETKVVSFVKAEEVIGEAVVESIFVGVETVVEAAEPAIVADIKTIMQAIPGEFIAGAGVTNIAAEVLSQALAAGKKEIVALEPQILETVVALLIHSL